MRIWIVPAFFTAIVSSTWSGSQVNAAACADICYTTELTGFGPGGVAGCVCSGSGPTRSGPGGCSCGQCYKEGNGGILGYAINNDGTCTFGTNCGDCTRSSTDSRTSKSTTDSSKAMNNSTDTSAAKSPSVTPASNNTTIETPSSPPTPVPNVSNPAAPNSTTTDAHDKTQGQLPNTSPPKTTTEEGLKTWQIAVIICCGVLVFTVAVVSVLSCYCKARNRLNENEDEQADASYYQQPYPRLRDDVFSTPPVYPTSNPSQPRSVSFESAGSLSNEMKPLYVNPATNGTVDRVGTGLAPVQMRHSVGEYVGSYPNPSKERILSGSYQSEGRFNGRKTSWEQGGPTTTREKVLSVDL